MTNATEAAVLLWRLSLEEGFAAHVLRAGTEAGPVAHRRTYEAGVRKALALLAKEERGEVKVVAVRKVKAKKGA